MISSVSTKTITLSLFLMISSSLRPNAPTDLVNVEKEIPGIKLEIVYATTNNFTKRAVYPCAKCYLRRPVVEKLKQVQAELKPQGLGLKIWDGYRPRSVQYTFWELVPDERYVADPKKGSRHNRGAAVDLTIIDLKTGKELEMPTAFDDFTEKAHRTCNNLPAQAIKNRDSLERLMTKHGFVGLPTEWWHFDDKDWQQYDLLDVSYSDLE